MRHVHLVPIFAFAALGAASCAAGDMQLNIDSSLTANDRAPGLAVVGVYKDGRIDPHYWQDEFGPRAASIVGGSCDLGFSERLRDEDDATYSRVDTDAKDGGLTDSTFAALQSRAGGPWMVAFSVVGHPPERTLQQTLTAQTISNPGTRKNMRGNRQTVLEHPTSMDALEVSLLVYSTERKQTVAHVAMRYTGSDPEKAMKTFFEKARAVLPADHCVPWKWQPEPPDAQARPRPAPEPAQMAPEPPPPPASRNDRDSR